MTTASATPGRRPDDEEREDVDDAVDVRHGNEGPSDQLKHAEARRLARMELERATDEGMPPPRQPSGAGESGDVAGRTHD